MAGQLDVRRPLEEAAVDMVKAGRPARFIMIPHAHHGEYGPDAVAVMQEGLSWVTGGEPDGHTPPGKTADLAR
jgi:hypothetical protein